MSAYYDLYETPDINNTGEQQPLHARIVPKGTIDRKEFIDRVHRFTGLSHAMLEGAMSAFMDELRDCLADGWTVELGELGYFTPSLNCRPVMEKNHLRSASIGLRGLNFRLGKEFYRELNGKIHFERRPVFSAQSPASVLTKEQCAELLKDYLAQYPCINRAQYSQLTGRNYKQAVAELNVFIADGLLMRHGMGKSVVYALKK